MSDDISKLPVKFKTPSEDRVLKRVSGPCYHRGFLVDESLSTVECSACHERLDPMWVLRQLSASDSLFHEMRKRYQDELQRLEKRSRTKCWHCGKMTGISHR